MNCTHHWTVTSECPMCLRKQLDDANLQIERAFQMLAANGVPRERARFLANGIDVLACRLNRVPPALWAVTIDGMFTGNVFDDPALAERKRAILASQYPGTGRWCHFTT